MKYLLVLAAFLVAVGGGPGAASAETVDAALADPAATIEAAAIDPISTHVEQAGGYSGPSDSRGRALAPFVGDLSASLNEFWSETLAQAGITYPTPPAVWVHGHQHVTTACGSREIDGPAHCGRDATVYLYAPFFEPLWTADYDFAVVTVIAHEWAHHVQNILGVRTRGVQRELMADCMAGMFGRWSEAQGYLESGDLEEALAISRASGDENHGTGEQRARAYLDGFQGRSCGAYA